ncbi:MAG: monovalent cation/H(+) antiporter subunit G [Legionellaceae bacterium]|nr:monovalent cation/H(+) antiporter subunit G [Legionellaceae bacterium]
MSIIDGLSCLFIALGAFFFLAGSLGLVRFPDVFTRLHALTKADNLGLGFIVAALLLQSPSWRLIVKYSMIWLLVLLSSATIGSLIAGFVRKSEPGREPRE